TSHEVTRTKRDATQALHRNGAANSIVYDIDSASVGERLYVVTERPHTVGGVAIDHMIASLGSDDRELGIEATRRDHPGTEDLRDLHRGQPGRARRAVDQHRLAFAKTRAEDQAVVRSFITAQQAARLIERKPSGYAQNARARGHTVRSEAAPTLVVA